MENPFAVLINSFIENNVGIADHFLTDVLSDHLKANLLTLFQSDELLSAGTGNSTLVSHDKLVRSDKIYWLDRKHEDQYENDFFDVMDRFVLYLNATCYTGITSYEFHYTLYEKGSFYKTHIDQFHKNGNRAYSMVMYLNENWKLGDGGELRVHHEGGAENISPMHGKSVFFKSNELAHEVLLTHEPRMSITGWLKV